MNDGSQESLASLRQQLLQLKVLHEAGTLDAQAYGQAKAGLEQRLVEAVLSGAADVAPRASPSRRLTALLSGLVLAIAVAGYAWTGSPGYDKQAAAAAQAPPAAGDADQNAQISAMVDKLAAKLKDKPDDPVGWAMLGRSYSMLGRHDDAVVAYQKAVALQADDAKLLADYADALAMKNNRSLLGEPTQLIVRALAIDPNNIKALALAGSAAFDRKDFASAVLHWEKLVRLSPPDADFVRQVQSGIDEARSLGKLPPSAVPSATPTAAATTALTANISGTVTLSAAIAAQASPEDTLFVFARAAEGPRMPLVILRKQVKDLPLQFSLDDSMAMSPAAKLSSFPKVVVTARVSKRGQAVPEAGDLQGQSAAVSLGASGLKIEIAEVVKAP